MSRILLVEDDMDLNLTMKAFLIRKGYEVSSCLDVSEAWDAVAENHIDLVISDIMMRNVDGFEFAHMLREDNQNIPIIFVSALGDINSKTRGFSEGIDDYMVKPVDFAELDLRIKALLRRAGIKERKRIELADFVMDEEERSAILNGSEIKLTSREFDILYKFLSYPKKTFTREALMNEFWPLESEATVRTVDVYVTRIREKTRDSQSFEIVTVRGLGYKAVLR